MDVSVIIVNYHSADQVIECINSIFEKTKDITIEIIVVDNASGYEDVSILQNTFGEKITVIESNENLGFGKANNLGAASASGKYLFLLNPDTILVNNAIYILWSYMENNPECGVAGGNLYTPEMTPAPSYCLQFDDLETERKSASWKQIIGDKIKQKLHSKFGSQEVIFKNVFNHDGEIRKVAYIFGADMMLPKALFDSVGGFDPDFFMYAEEEELSWRITQEDYSIMNIPDAKIIHLEGVTVKAQNTFSDRQFRMRMDGAMVYYKKRFGMDGVQKFYQIRSKRYERLSQIAKWQGKLTATSLPLIQKRCLTEVYEQFIELQKNKEEYS